MSAPQQPSQRRAIDGEKFIRAMHRAGVVPALCRRVVIDAPADGCVVVWYECVGDAVTLDALLSAELIAQLKVAAAPVTRHVVTENDGEAEE